MAADSHHNDKGNSDPSTAENDADATLLRVLGSLAEVSFARLGSRRARPYDLMSELQERFRCTEFPKRPAGIRSCAA